MLLRSQARDRKATIGSGFEKKVLLKKISEMHDLPVLDVNISKIVSLLRNENVVIDELVTAIGHDAGLVAKILKLINSGYYSLRHTVTSVERAVVLLGILNIKQLVYSAAILDFYSYDNIVEWNHAYTSSLLMNNLMEEHILPTAVNLPLAMLMHDIGKVVLRRYSPDRFREAITMSQDDVIPVFQAEEVVLGIDHADVGGMLLEKWGMAPETFVTVRQHHCSHAPEEYGVETAMVQLVNWIDSSARSITALRPDQALLSASGLSGINTDAMIERQREFIAASENEKES
jgi:HD-like signal output (HDOD) protein